MISQEQAAAYGAVGILFVLALLICASILVACHIIGPRRHGAVKDRPYESGMEPIVGARRRFHVRFYLVAILFLLFDVEVALLWPWATVFVDACRGSSARYEVTQRLAASGFDAPALFGVAGIFVAILLIGYIYAWRTGAFRFQ